MVNQLVPDRLLVRFAYSLPASEVRRVTSAVGTVVGGSATSGIYELRLRQGVTPQQALERLAAVQGPSEAHGTEPLVHPVADFLGTFESQDVESRYPSVTQADRARQRSALQEKLRRVPNDPLFPSQAGFADLPRAWFEERGGAGHYRTQYERELVIALIDTGLDVEHEDLRDNLWVNADEQPGDANGDGCPGLCGKDDDGDGGADFDDPDVRELLARGVDRARAAADDDENGYPDDVHGYDFAAETPDVSDLTGHGTHVAGVVGAVGDNQVGVAGVLWSVRLMPLKVARRQDGLAPLDAILQAMRYAGQNGADIVLHSYVITLERPSSETIANLRAAFGRTGTKHLLHVAAAGNQSRDLGRKRPPGDDGLQSLVSDQGFFVFPVSLRVETVVAVAAQDEALEHLAPFSNRGEEVVQLAAPGSNLLSTLPGNQYGYRSGTSVAAAYIAGAVGLLLNRYPELAGRPTEVVELLRQRSVPFENPNQLTSLWYQLTHPPVLAHTLNDQTPSRFPHGFCGTNTYDTDLLDADGDGDLDLLAINGNPGVATNNANLFLNDGEGRFADASASLSPAATGINALAADYADIDGDGDLDLALATFSPASKEILLVNQGNLQAGTEGVFADLSDELPDNLQTSRDVDFCDFDCDGAPDLFVTNVEGDRVLRNVMGSGVALTPCGAGASLNTSCLTSGTDCFEDRTATWLAGIPNGDGHNSRCLDVDLDGDPDVVTMNLNDGARTGQDMLLLNRSTRRPRRPRRRYRPLDPARRAGRQPRRRRPLQPAGAADRARRRRRRLGRADRVIGLAPARRSGAGAEQSRGDQHRRGLGDETFGADAPRRRHRSLGRRAGGEHGALPLRHRRRRRSRSPGGQRRRQLRGLACRTASTGTAPRRASTPAAGVLHARDERHRHPARLRPAVHRRRVRRLRRRRRPRRGVRQLRLLPRDLHQRAGRRDADDQRRHTPAPPWSASGS